jgi:hypothetical protein
VNVVKVSDFFFLWNQHPVPVIIIVDTEVLRLRHFIGSLAYNNRSSALRCGRLLQSGALRRNVTAKLHSEFLAVALA